MKDGFGDRGVSRPGNRPLSLWYPRIQADGPPVRSSVCGVLSLRTAAVLSTHPYVRDPFTAHENKRRVSPEFPWSPRLMRSIHTRWTSYGRGELESLL